MNKDSLLPKIWFNVLNKYGKSSIIMGGTIATEKEKETGIEERETRVIKVVLDALKPREVPIVELSKSLCALDGINEVEVSVMEVDVKTETVKILVKGDNIDLDEVSRVIEKNGVAIRSVDDVAVKK